MQDLKIGACSARGFYQSNIPIEKGMVRHHVAYHFDNPDKGSVVISRKLHQLIHTNKGCFGGEKTRGLGEIECYVCKDVKQNYVNGLCKKCYTRMYDKATRGC